MREPIHHLTPSQVRKRELFTRQVQLTTQDHAAESTLRDILYAQRASDCDRAILRELVALPDCPSWMYERARRLGA